ncbi:alpha/beta fold hydrolase [Caulobacter sp. S45]|uniref:alpha/beta fold hydrolase n=1 Tax=Caulobacter sp. S45 TaxID=1641861 RepID=UPI0015773337|nr:alpha/beta fold hydrolase [Caulobacter sp. S45]
MLRPEPPRSDRRRALLGLIGAGGVAACQPRVQGPGVLPESFRGPRLELDSLVASDGARLPMTVWDARDGGGRATPPWAVIVGLHGMNDYSAAFGLAGPYWATQGVTTYAYDQRGFGRAAHRGVWGGEALMDADLRTAAALVRARHPGAIVAVVGESMGGAVGISAFASDAPPVADRLVLASPAVWGWREQGLPNSAALWVSAHVAPGSRLTAPNWLARRIRASDNISELRRMGLDRNMIFATRIDTIYGLVELMQHAQDEVGETHVPTFYQYGAHDDIIPKHAAFRAARRLKPGDRSAYYATGYHLLLRDLHRQVVLDDVLAFVRDPTGPLPSGAPPIPRRKTRDARMSAPVSG